MARCAILENNGRNLLVLITDYAHKRQRQMMSEIEDERQTDVYRQERQRNGEGPQGRPVAPGR